MKFISQEIPQQCTGTIARVCDVIAASINCSSVLRIFPDIDKDGNCSV